MIAYRFCKSRHHEPGLYTICCSRLRILDIPPAEWPQGGTPVLSNVTKDELRALKKLIEELLE